MINITIPTDFDFTPIGKRAARVVQTRRGTQLRWYVGGRLYVKGADPRVTAEWLEGAGKPGHRPQPWDAFA